MIDRLFALFVRVPLRTALLTLLAAALIALGVASYLERRQVRTLNASVANVSGNLAALEERLGTLSSETSDTASSTANLAADLAASSRAETAALKSQGSALQTAVAVATPGVVSIVALDASGQQAAAGTGFFVRATGYIVTNRHVVEDSTLSYTVITASGRQEPATVLWLSPSEDLAIVKVPD